MSRRPIPWAAVVRAAFGAVLCLAVWARPGRLYSQTLGRIDWPVVGLLAFGAVIGALLTLIILFLALRALARRALCGGRPA